MALKKLKLAASDLQIFNQSIREAFPRRGTGRLGLTSLTVISMYVGPGLDGPADVLKAAKFFKGVGASTWNTIGNDIDRGAQGPGGFVTRDYWRAANFSAGSMSSPKVGQTGVILILSDLVAPVHVVESGYSASHGRLWPEDYRCQSSVVVGVLIVKQTGISAVGV